MEKASYFVTGRYKIFGEGLQLYGDILYAKVKQDNGLAGAPFAMTSASNGLTEARNSPFNPAGNQLSSVTYRLQQDLGNRRSFFDKDYWRYVIGINGDFNFKDNSFISRFGYDTGFVYTRFDEQEIDSGDAHSDLHAPTGLSPELWSRVVLFNPFIGQNAPLIGTAPIYNNTNSPCQFQTGVPIGPAPYNNSCDGPGCLLHWS